LLALHPLAANLSFHPSITLRREALPPQLYQVLTPLSVLVGSIHQAPLRLNALLLQHAVGSPATLLQPIMAHYSLQAQLLIPFPNHSALPHFGLCFIVRAGNVGAVQGNRLVGHCTGLSRQPD